MILNGRNSEKLEELQRLIMEAPGTADCRIVCGDVGDISVTEACITACRDAWDIDPSIFLANAGRGLPGTVINSDPKEWDSLIDTNIKGVLNQLRTIGTAMLGTITLDRDFIKFPLDIIVIGSTIGRNVSPFNSVYGATKFATHGVTEALRRELGPHGIRVTLIEPGIVETNFQASAGYSKEWFEQYAQDIGPVLIPDDISGLIGYLIDLPGNVNLENITIRPTRQAYP